MTATVRLPLRGGQTEAKKGQIVQVDARSETHLHLLLGVEEADGGRIQYISPSAIVEVDTTPENLDIINDWLYWHDQDLLPA